MELEGVKNLRKECVRVRGMFATDRVIKSQLNAASRIIGKVVKLVAEKERGGATEIADEMVEDDGGVGRDRLFDAETVLELLEAEKRRGKRQRGDIDNDKEEVTKRSGKEDVRKGNGKEDVTKGNEKHDVRKGNGKEDDMKRNEKEDERNDKENDLDV